jgi:hypothetical protein
MSRWFRTSRARDGYASRIRAPLPGPHPHGPPGHLRLSGDILLQSPRALQDVRGLRGQPRSRRRQLLSAALPRKEGPLPEPDLICDSGYDLLYLGPPTRRNQFEAPLHNAVVERQDETAVSYERVATSLDE